MIRHTDQKTISQIFPNDNGILYKIPKYQRKYTWGVTEWDLIFNDVIDNEPGYFLGSIICVELGGTAYERSRNLEVIDGQQRMTTLSILLTVLYSKINEYKDSLDEEQQTDLTNLKRELVFKVGDNYVPRLQLQVQDNNASDYNYLLHKCGIIDYANQPRNAGNRKIFKCFKYFDKLINTFLESNETDEYDNLRNENPIITLLNIVKRFNDAVLVTIEVDSHKDAYMLFESLNNRGVPLTAVDLIKNLLIAISDSDGKSDECYEKWIRIQSYLGEEYSVQERFFRQYYNAFREELNEPWIESENSGKKFPLAYLATKTTLMEIYEKLIKRDYNKFLKDIEYAAINYSLIINNSETKLIEYQNLERIQGAPSYLLLLYLEMNKESLNISSEQIKDLTKLLISFFVRRNITDIPNTRNLTKIFMDIINDIKLNNGYSYSVVKDKLVGVSATDEMFVKKLRGPIYDDNDTATRFILCSIEEKYHTREIYTDLWSRDTSNKYIWTIEHIFPEGQNIPQDWVVMIAGGNRELAYDYLNDYVHNLGNLTITGYNQNLSNLSFERKKNRKNSEGKDVGYNNGLYLNRDVASEDDWTVDKIEARTSKLIAEVTELFKL